MIFDVHNDFLTALSGAEIPKTVMRFFEQDLKGLVAVVWTSKMLVNAQEQILKVTEPLKALKTQFPHCYALEDLHFVDDIALDTMDFSQYKYCSLTWNYENNLASGALAEGGLKPHGKKVINALENANCIVDTAHLNLQSFWDVADNTYSLINSHTAFTPCHNHPRNINDEQIKEIISRDGIIGLCLVTTFLANNSISEVARTIDYYVQRYGFSNLVIGSDFYGTEDLPVGLKNYTGFEHLRILLENFGYSNKVIDDIFFNNAGNFFLKEHK